jgi:hypothetical protein
MRQLIVADLIGTFFMRSRVKSYHVLSASCANFPCAHGLDEWLKEYLAAGIVRHDVKAPLFCVAAGKRRQLTYTPYAAQAVALRCDGCR